jgi:alpha-beta hydrolase superfamily lysophospholipase
MHYQEQHLESAEDGRLYVRAHRVDGDVRGEVVLTHGRGEHCGRYSHVGDACAARGLRLWSYDLRGHGRSSGRRGDLLSYRLFLEDLDTVVALANGERRPVFLLGHSLGGQITLNYLDRHPHSCQGAVVASPYLRLAFAPPRWRLVLARLVGGLWPAFTQEPSVRAEHLSRDLAHLSSMPDPELMHRRISARMFEAIRRGAEHARLAAGRIGTPLLLLHGEQDPVTCMRATREFFDQSVSRDKTLRTYPEMLHETHNEIGRERVIEEVLDWILARVGPPQQPSQRL